MNWFRKSRALFLLNSDQLKNANQVTQGYILCKILWWCVEGKGRGEERVQGEIKGEKRKRGNNNWAKMP